MRDSVLWQAYSLTLKDQEFKLRKERYLYKVFLKLPFVVICRITEQ